MNEDIAKRILAHQETVKTEEAEMLHLAGFKRNSKTGKQVRKGQNYSYAEALQHAENEAIVATGGEHGSGWRWDE